MKTSKFLIGWMVLAVLASMPATSFAFMEDLSQAATKSLDGVENLVKQSGLVEAKKKLWEDYGLLIKPFFKFRYDLTSNVFKAPDTDSDFTDNLWTYSPGFQWLYKMSKGVIGGAYEASLRYFTQNPGQNEQDQKFLVYANIFPSEATYIRVSEKIDQQGSTAGSTAFDPIDFMDNTVNVVAGYHVGEDWTLEAGYQNFDRDFSTTLANRYNYNENMWDYRGYYQYSDNLKVYSGFRLGTVSFSKDTSRDTTYFEFPLGVEGRLPYDVDLRASVGFHRRNLEESSRNDVNHVVTNIALQKTMNHDRTSVEFGFLRRPVESAFSTATTYDEKLWYGDLKHLMTQDLRARMNLYAGNRDFEEAVFTGARVVIGGVTFAVPADQVKRDDQVFGFGFGFDYHVRKWMIMHLDYQYSRRDSNISALDYTENVFSLGSTIPL